MSKKPTRSVSQILFSFLPEQTVDVNGGIWKVEEWTRARNETGIDIASLRRELARLARPWAQTGRDEDYVRDIEHRKISVTVKSLDRDRGVRLKPFPRLWFCRTCRRLHDEISTRCDCGGMSKGQLQFVHYCNDCGEIRAPNPRRCQQHQQVRINFPGTASGKEIVFDCPICSVIIQRGFGYARSACGSSMGVNVHRAASVYTPRSVVIVNPPNREKVKAIEEAGGAPRALTWVLDGMKAASSTESTTSIDVVRRSLRSQGLPEDAIERMISAMGRSDLQQSDIPDLAADVREAAEEQALSIALAMTESRIQIADLARDNDPNSARGILLLDRYPLALEAAGLSRVDLVDCFPVLTGHFGYTRGNSTPGESRLKTFRERNGGYIVFGDLAETEALFFALDPIAVARWLSRCGYPIEPPAEPDLARRAILSGFSSVGSEMAKAVELLVHSYAHRMIRLTAIHAGIERSALSELLVPMHLGFFVYAAARGDFVLGGLQAVFENDLDRLLRAMIQAEHRCALDPGCSAGGGACVGCLHLGEPSCRLFNQSLDRDALSGANGYFRKLNSN